VSLLTDLKQKGLWNSYARHVVGLEPVLRRMAKRGVPVDPTVYDEVGQILKRDHETALQKMQEIVPDEIKNKKFYKKTPKNLKGTYQTPEGVWYRVAQWKPSNKGLLSYIRFKGHRVPTDYKTKKETTKEIEVRRLYGETGDPLYRAVVDYRKAGTILNNFMVNWKPGADSRVHTTFYFDPATGQLSSRRPNIQNAPKHDDPEFGGYAKVFRRMIKAPAGYVIMEFDFKSFHAQTLAFEAQDKDYLRLAKLDIHSYLAAHFIHEPKAKYIIEASDAELKDYLKWIKKNHAFVRDYKAKRAILGYGFGMQYKKLYDMNKESFENQTEAKRLLKLLDELFPRAKAWRDEIRQRAHQQGYLISRHGYIRHFWEVYKWKGGEWKNGDDSEAAIAFLPANDAFGEIRDRMLWIVEQGLDEKYGLCNTVHDSLIFECPLELADECRIVIPRLMETPSKVLVNSICPDGLSVEVDAKSGPSWGEGDFA
jgi:DNA polymerase I-like protein with 3'-5' exonuclease and polymerase domains